MENFYDNGHSKYILNYLMPLVFNQDFSCGYSPERINPGDKVNTLPKIIKVVSGSNEYSTKD